MPRVVKKPGMPDENHRPTRPSESELTISLVSESVLNGIVILTKAAVRGTVIDKRSLCTTRAPRTPVTEKMQRPKRIQRRDLPSRGALLTLV